MMLSGERPIWVPAVLHHHGGIHPCGSSQEGIEVHLRQKHVRGVAIDFASFHVAAKYRILVAEGAVGERGINTVIILIGRALAVFGTVHQPRNVDGEFVLEYDAVEFEVASIGGVPASAADAELELVGVAEASLGQVIVDNAGGRSQSEEEGVGAAIDVDTLRIVGVERNVGHEEVTRPVRSGQAANARGSVRVAASAAYIGFPETAFARSRNITKNPSYF